jgi:hypothetical protein
MTAKGPSWTSLPCAHSSRTTGWPTGVQHLPAAVCNVRVHCQPAWSADCPPAYTGGWHGARRPAAVLRCSRIWMSGSRPSTSPASAGPRSASPARRRRTARYAVPLPTHASGCDPSYTSLNDAELDSHPTLLVAGGLHHSGHVVVEEQRRIRKLELDHGQHKAVPQMQAPHREEPWLHAHELLTMPSRVLLVRHAVTWCCSIAWTMQAL